MVVAVVIDADVELVQINLKNLILSFYQQNMYQQQFQLPSHQPLLFQPQLYQPLFQPQFLHQSQFFPHHSSSQQQPTQQFQNLERNKEAKAYESINQRIKSIQSIQNENFLHHDKFASTENVKFIRFTILFLYYYLFVVNK